MLELEESKQHKGFTDLERNRIALSFVNHNDKLKNYCLVNNNSKTSRKVAVNNKLDIISGNCDVSLPFPNGMFSEELIRKDKIRRQKNNKTFLERLNHKFETNRSAYNCSKSRQGVDYIMETSVHSPSQERSKLSSLI